MPVKMPVKTPVKLIKNERTTKINKLPKPNVVKSTNSKKIDYLVKYLTEYQTKIKGSGIAERLIAKGIRSSEFYSVFLNLEFKDKLFVLLKYFSKSKNPTQFTLEYLLKTEKYTVDQLYNKFLELDSKRK